MNFKRIRLLREGRERPGPVAFWMSRDQRVRDNWALLFAREMALKRKQPLFVVFCLVPHYLGATVRHYDFMVKGLREVEKSLIRKNIPLYLLCGSPATEIPGFVSRKKVGILVTDFSPLKIKRDWEKSVGSKLDIPFYQVDAHNIVPCWVASEKQEYAAYTFRPKILRMLDEFMEEFPPLRKHPHPPADGLRENDWDRAISTLTVDSSVKPASWLRPGETAARRMLRTFIEEKIMLYAEKRNDPLADVQSNLSPYLHFGQISAQRCALEIGKNRKHGKVSDAFMEELIVRRELSDNFCYYNNAYDNPGGFPRWAHATLSRHRKDKREYIYTLADFETGKTHDDLWNAAQNEMVKKGKMHGYLRMYWAKKILEWTGSPDEALRIAIYLNDKYELDGRDPNGYAGIAWSIGGVHDRAWNERRIFGKIRYMSYYGCKSKFDVRKYISYVDSIETRE